MLFGVAHERVDTGMQSLRGGQGWVGRRERAGLGGSLARNGHVEVTLGGEVVVEQSPRDAGELCDLLDPDLLISPGREQAHPDAQQLRASLIYRQPPTRTPLSHWQTSHWPARRAVRGGGVVDVARRRPRTHRRQTARTRPGPASRPT